LEAGYVLLIAAGVAAIIGWDLARRGFVSVDAAAAKTRAAAEGLRTVVAGAQATLAAESGAEAHALAQANEEAVQKLGVLEDAIDGIKSALAGLTGSFAPARVAFALSFLLILAALVALDIVSVTVASNGG
jgi:hypothetical protein